MVQTVSAIDLNQYVKTDYDSYAYADYVIEGRIQLTDQINICKLYSKEVEYDEDNESAVENCTLF